MGRGGKELSEDVATVELSPFMLNPKRALCDTFAAFVIGNRIVLLL